MPTSTSKRGGAFIGTTLWVAWHMALFIVLLALCASIAQRWIDGDTMAFPMMSSNAAVALLLFTLLAASVGFATMMMAAIHGGQWNETTRFASLSSNLVTFAILALAFGFACKVINRGDADSSNTLNQQMLTVAALDIIGLATLLCYLMHIGLFKHTPPEERAGGSAGAAGTAAPKTFVGGHEERALAA